ncbi:MAG TPA: ABC transporter ATP-binding protein [Desulfobacteraceae bacterium]|nr:ABC transporter ATP-binding protein [Desulfobacteraceae bacterium]
MISEVITPYFRQNKKNIAVGILFLIVVDFFQIVIPWMVKSAINALSLDQPDIHLIFKYTAAIVLAGGGIAVLRYWWRILLMGTARRMERGLREDLFDHVLKLDARYYDRIKTGDLMAHATSDINHIRLAFGIGMIALTDAFFLGGAIIAFMLYMNTKLALLALSPMPLLILTAKSLGKRMHNLHSIAQESYSALTELIRESFYGIRILKVYNYETIVGNKAAAASRNYFEKNFKRAMVTALIKPLMVFFLNLSMFIIIFYGGFLVMEDRLSPGELVAFLQYMWLLAWPMIAIGWMINLVQRGLASLKRIEAVVTTVPGVKSPAKAEFLTAPVKSIEFQGVSFSYAPLDNGVNGNALDEIFLSVPAGRFIGITGPPGSGKTSLVQLFPRIYDPCSGKILFNGQDMKASRLESVRKKVAFMPQEAFLFSGTIRENIVMGNDVSEEQLMDVIKPAQLETTLDQMPAGLETLVGERGITLSGGQKQRIALARTLVQEKEIIILDDPVSQVDTDTASEIIKGLAGLKNKRTMVIVSHRISALTACDTIYVLKDGTVEDQGSHDSLMENNGFYRNTHALQL